MRAAEFIFEALLHDTVKDIAVWISPHVNDQRQKPERMVSWAEINKILKRIKIVRPKLYDMLHHNQFYLRDNDTNVELGCVMVDLHGTPDETPTVKYLLKINTVIRSASPEKRESPLISVNAVIKEDNDTYSIKCNTGEEIACNDFDHAVNRARKLLSYNKCQEVFIIKNGEITHKWALGVPLKEL